MPEPPRAPGEPERPLHPRTDPAPKRGPRWVFITGATQGIGLQAAIELAKNGDRVILGARNREKGEQAKKQVMEEAPGSDVHLAVGDLSTKEGTRAQARAVLEQTDTLDVLVLNAGMSHPHRRTSKDGVELTFAVNHLSAFRMAHLLEDAIKKSDHPRVIVVSSHAHRSAKLVPDDLELEHHRYTGWLQYCNTKLLNLLFTMELSRRWRTDGVTVNALHPGVVATGIARNWFFGRIAFRLFGRSPRQGADTIVHLATDPIGRKVTGQYFAERKPLSAKRIAYDEGLQKSVWETSETYGV